MKNDLLQKAAKVNRDNRWKRIWHRVTTVLASIVIFCTTYALILPAITMELEEDLLLKQNERNENYSSDNLLQELLLGTQTTDPAPPPHTHSDACYTAEFTAVCGIDETDGHVHSDSCYADVATLTCTQAETEGHLHDDGCYGDLPVLDCSQEETDGHTHGDACYGEVSHLICSVDETDGHTHSDACMTTTLSCGEDAETHTHTDDCYEQTLSCGMEECQPHQHSDSCYELATDLLCGEPELPAHSHSESCYIVTNGLICGKEEQAPHSHDEPCYTTQHQLVCGQTEHEAHHHTAECLTAEWVLTCGQSGTGSDPPNLPTPEWTGETPIPPSEELGQIPEELPEELVEPPPPRQYDFEDDVVAVSVILPEDSAVPEDAVLTVTAITYEDANYDELAQQANDAVDGVAEEVVLYDVSFLTAEDEYLPVSETATVSFRFKEQIITPTEDSEVAVLHYTEEAETPVILETLETALDEDEALAEITFQTEGFSVFAVVKVASGGNSAGWTWLTGSDLNLDNLHNLDPIIIVGDNNLYTVMNGGNADESTNRRDAVKYDSEAALNNAAGSITQWIFERQGTNQYRIRIGTNGAYLRRSNGNLTTDNNWWNATTFTVTMHPDVDNCVTIRDGTYYINLFGGDPYRGFGAYQGSETDPNQRFRLYVYHEATISPVTDLDGKTYAIVNHQSGTTGYSMLSSFGDNTSHRGAEKVEITSTDNAAYVIGTNIHTWTFEAVDAENGTYRIKDPKSGEYLMMNNSGLYRGSTGTVFTVSGNDSGKVQITAGGYAVTLNGTTSFQSAATNINSAAQWQTLAEEISGKIRYHINLTTPAVADPPTVFGEEVYTEDFVSVVGDEYIVRAPSASFYMAENTIDFWYHVNFKGWMVNGDEAKILQPGTILTDEEFKAYAMEDDTVELIAKWEGSWGTNRPFTGNFYLSLDCQVMNQEEGLASQTDFNNFTASVFGTHMNYVLPNGTVQNTNPYPNNPVYFLAKAEDSSTSATVDAAIRGMNTVGLSNQADDRHQYDNYTVFTADFPEDEYVFEQLRKQQADYIAAYEAWRGDDASRTVTRYRQEKNKIIIYKGEYIPADQLTMENYSIRWYVTKYMDSGWHIDGVLVSKLGRLTVTKSFFGDQAMIQQVKDRNGNGRTDLSQDYYIEVLGPMYDPVNKVEIQDGNPYNLNLQPYHETNNPDGYTEYDPATDTYSWVITVYKETDYRVQEKNYIYNNNEKVTSAEYMIENSGAATGKWMQYNQEKVGVHIKAYSYWDEVDPDDYQKLHFRNSYVPEGTLLVWKEDYQSQRPIPYVQFQLTDSADNPVMLYHETGTDENRYLLYEPVSYDKIIMGGPISCNSEGFFMINFAEGTEFSAANFKLTELSVPEGYEPITDVISFNLDADGNLTLTGGFDVAYQPSYVDGGVTVIDTKSIHITNRPKTTQIIVKKDWAAGDTQEQVVLQLLKDGVPIPQGTDAGGNPIVYRVTLDGVVDAIETVPWTASWTGLPLYSGGKAINYSLREVFIGDAAYNLSGDSTDGFVDYIVTQEAPEYYDSDGNPVSGALYPDADGNLQSAAKVRLVIRNERDKGMLKFLKMNEKGLPLAGAKFTIYTDPACTTPYPSGELESDADGVARFFGLAAAVGENRYYYMKETEAPHGYITPDTVYKITVSVGSPPVITVVDGDGDDSNDVVVNQILNQPLQAELQLKKTDEVGRSVTGVQFQLLVKDGSIYVPYTAGGKANGLYDVSADGWINFGTIPDGDYRMVETITPNGYNAYSGDIRFHVETGVITLTAYDPNLVSINSTSPYVITVVNLTSTLMPETGGIGTHWYTQGGMLLMALAVLVFGYDLRRKRERRNE